MSFKIELSIYNELIAKYPTWDKLHTYLESEAGGGFRIVDKDDNGYCIIRYEKGFTNMELPHSRWFRSVVWNTLTNLPVCIAPPKATTTEFPFKTFADIKTANVVCQEHIEGFMINCFRVCEDNTLHITSRSKLDATGKFCSDKTLKGLFIEAYADAFNTHNQDEMFSNIKAPISTNGEVSIFYSFLVQHVEHRIVKKHESNKVYVIHKGCVYNDGRVSLEDICADDSSAYNSHINTINVANDTNVMRYADIVNNSESEIDKWIKNLFAKKFWDFQGVVFKDDKGNRWRFRSNSYMAVKSLRGNSPCMIDRYVQLYMQNLSMKYLEYYPEDKNTFNIYNSFLNSIIKTIYNNYVQVHVTKTKNINDIDKSFMPHLYNIHGLYLSQLRSINRKITINDVHHYIYKQPWQRVAFLLKQKIGDKKISTFSIS
jgi:hypothetical protein